MDNQVKDLKLEKDKKRLSQTRKENSGKRELENARKKERKLLKKTGSKIACKNFICLSYLNLKVDIFFITADKLNILLQLNFDLHRSK